MTINFTRHKINICTEKILAKILYKPTRKYLSNIKIEYSTKSNKDLQVLFLKETNTLYIDNVEPFLENFNGTASRLLDYIIRREGNSEYLLLPNGHIEDKDVIFSLISDSKVNIREKLTVHDVEFTQETNALSARGKDVLTAILKGTDKNLCRIEYKDSKICNIQSHIKRVGAGRIAIEELIRRNPAVSRWKTTGQLSDGKLFFPKMEKETNTHFIQK